MAKEVQLSDPPSDGVSAVRFSPGGEFVVAASWDTSVRLYDVAFNGLKSRYHHKAAVLDACFGGPSLVFSGGLDMAVRMHDFGSGADSVLGSHGGAVRAVEYSTAHNLLVSGSWDKTVKAWDHRSASAEVASVPVEERVYAMSACGANMVLVATAARKIIALDVRKLAAKEDAKLWTREPSVRHQIRCVRAFADGDVYAVGSIEGRVAIEFVSDAPTVQANKYTFKCHRVANKATGEERVFPVNAMASHPKQAVFATGGADGTVSIWDPTSKKRLAQVPAYPTSVSSLAFSPCGTKLAIGVSYTFEQGDIEHPQDNIVIRTLLPTETAPRAR
jgi:cell cycle arrest protein BUB3